MNDVLTDLEIEVKSNISEEQLEKYIEKIEGVTADVKKGIIDAWDSLPESVKKIGKNIKDLGKKVGDTVIEGINNVKEEIINN